MSGVSHFIDSSSDLCRLSKTYKLNNLFSSSYYGKNFKTNLFTFPHEMDYESDSFVSTEFYEEFDEEFNEESDIELYEESDERSDNEFKNEFDGLFDDESDKHSDNEYDEHSDNEFDEYFDSDESDEEYHLVNFSKRRAIKRMRRKFHLIYITALSWLNNMSQWLTNNIGTIFLTLYRIWSNKIICRNRNITFNTMGNEINYHMLPIITCLFFLFGALILGLYQFPFFLTIISSPLKGEPFVVYRKGLGKFNYLLNTKMFMFYGKIVNLFFLIWLICIQYNITSGSEMPLFGVTSGFIQTLVTVKILKNSFLLVLGIDLTNLCLELYKIFTSKEFDLSVSLVVCWLITMSISLCIFISNKNSNYYSSDSCNYKEDQLKKLIVRLVSLFNMIKARNDRANFYINIILDCCKSIYHQNKKLFREDVMEIELNEELKKPNLSTLKQILRNCLIDVKHFKLCDEIHIYEEISKIVSKAKQLLPRLKKYWKQSDYEFKIIEITESVIEQLIDIKLKRKMMVKKALEEAKMAGVPKAPVGYHKYRLRRLDVNFTLREYWKIRPGILETFLYTLYGIIDILIFVLIYCIMGKDKKADVWMTFGKMSFFQFLLLSLTLKYHMDK